jgi:hypothetical protein
MHCGERSLQRVDNARRAAQTRMPILGPLPAPLRK